MPGTCGHCLGSAVLSFAAAFRRPSPYQVQPAQPGDCSCDMKFVQPRIGHAVGKLEIPGMPALQVVGVVPVTGPPTLVMGLSCLGLLTAGPGWLPAGERDDVAIGAGAHVTELLVFQGELVHRADEGGDVSAEPGEFLVLAGDRLPEPGDGGAEPGLVAVVRASFLDALVELVLQVNVALGERVAWDPGLEGERYDGQGAVGSFGGASQDAVHRGADLGALVGLGGHSASFLVVVMRVRSCLSAWLSRASARLRSWAACEPKRARPSPTRTQWSKVVVSLTPSPSHRARSPL